MAVHKKYNRNAKVSALGRGLDALISTVTASAQGSSTINEVPIDQIEANPDQPRREFDSVALEELANSIKQLGLVQPITVRQLAEHKFQIIAGERRWRASQLAGLTAIPAYIRTIKDENVGTLKKLKDYIEKKNYKVAIYGHTDSKGTESYNSELSLRRAENVEEKLVELGLAPERIVKTIGEGSKKPVASNDTEEGRAMNRRIELEFFAQK